MEEAGLGGSGRLPSGWGRSGGQGGEPPRRPVWVDLDALYATAPPDTDAVSVDEAGEEQRPMYPGVTRRGRLECSGEVHGVLHGWERGTDDGQWLGVVSYTVPFTRPDPRPGKRVEFGLLPARAIRPREGS